MPEIDNTGDRIEERYSSQIVDPYFERRLKAFDPRLRLMFDFLMQRWVILEEAYDNSGWNIILIAQDDEKRPKPLGEWVFNQLFVYRKRWERARSAGVDQWQKELQNEAGDQRSKKEEKLSERIREQLIDDINIWRKAAKELDGLPVSDVTAGYSKRGNYAPASRVHSDKSKVM